MKPFDIEDLSQKLHYYVTDFKRLPYRYMITINDIQCNFCKQLLTFSYQILYLKQCIKPASENHPAIPNPPQMWVSSIPFRIHINSGNNDNSALLLIIKIFSVRDQICKWIFSFRVRIYTCKLTMTKNAKIWVELSEYH